MKDLVSTDDEERSIAQRIEDDATPALQLLVNRSGSPVALNQTARRFVAESSINTWHRLFAENEISRWIDMISASSSQQIPVSGCFLLRRFDKAVRRFVLRAEPKYTGTGVFLGHVVSGMDISDITPAETQATQPHQAVGSTDAMHWHDELVSVATVLSGYVDLLPDLLNGHVHPNLADVLVKLQTASCFLRDTVTELSSRARASNLPIDVTAKTHSNAYSAIPD